VAERVTTEKWFDGTYWGATLPAGWRFFRDRTIDGFPHVFESASGSRLQIGMSKDVRHSGPEEDIPEELKTELEKLVYVVTLGSARIDDSWSWYSFPRMLFPLIRQRALVRRELGVLTGFTYEIDKGSGWAGFLASGRWMLYARLTSNARAFRSDSETALLILASLTFH
jgi:hypothetical protein